MTYYASYESSPILVDAHTHTVASGHAYSSLQEMAHAASERGIEVLGITEHGPAIEGTCPLIFFRNSHVIPRVMYGVRLLIGCEINILNTHGEIDYPDDYFKYLDIGIAGIHSACWDGGSKSENTSAVESVMLRDGIHIISHPGDGTADLDFRRLVEVSKSTHTLLEVNNHSLAPSRGKKNALENNLEIMRLCKDMDVPLILGSDAHISFQVADYARLYPLLAETSFPKELIINLNPQLFYDYTGIEVQMT